MLSVNKPLMDQKFNALYDSAFRQAAYNAYYNTNNKSTPSISFDPNDDPDIISQTNAKIRESELKREEDLKKDANKFADEFVNQLKSAKLLETISDEIDGHIKAMKLVIAMLPQGIATLVSPMGPCTGSMIISDETANINIL